MKRFVPRIAALLFLVVAGTLAPAAAEERPFHAAGEGNVSNILYGNGEATHLGRSRLYVDVQMDFLSYGLFVPNGGIIVSASGDVLDFFFDEQEYDFDPETGVVSATLRFISGAGRFENAAGSADVMFVFDPALQSFSFQIDGSIDY